MIAEIILGMCYVGAVIMSCVYILIIIDIIVHHQRVCLYLNQGSTIPKIGDRDDEAI